MTTKLSKKRLDYKKPSHTIHEVDLTFELDKAATKVVNRMRIERLDKDKGYVDLDGENLTLLSVSLNGELLKAGEGYELFDSYLRVFSGLDNFELIVENSNSPINNTSLEGLYFSNKAYCTQCEAEGFRKITYYLDRPDVLAVYTVTINCVDEELTYLLSNGNLISDTGFHNGKRSVVWKDPHPKPSYLFALVAGHFDKLEDTFITKSNRNVSLQLFVDEGRLSQGHHALASLKKAMQWDEHKYGLEYDLDIYMIVAVDFFNMGAMENKGLNVFNSKYVLADENTATDEDYFNIESVIAHEYFHNWTGNRVTCRDWFQLSLKEGLTVFRDQQFSADMYSPLITRINQVKVMREHQFAEDASPMSHPIRPDEVIEMNNFYTVTVYDKGAEVIRMLNTLLTESGFRKGMDLYFERHDGQAVTCDDFVNAMQDANSIDLSHFKLWYSQSGTPVVSVKRNVESVNGKEQVSFEFSQITKATADQHDKESLYIPIKMECFDSNGSKLETGLLNDTYVLNQESDQLVIDGGSEVTPSLLQNFSAPVKIDYEYSFDDLLVILRNASSDYAKWEASQSAYLSLIKKVYQNNKFDVSALQSEIGELAGIITQLDVKNEVMAQLIALPSTESLMLNFEHCDVLRLDKSREALQGSIANALEPFCFETYQRLHNALSQLDYMYEKAQVNQRQLKNMCLKTLSCSDSNQVGELITQQFKSSTNMTDRLASLKAASEYSEDVFHQLMQAFEELFSDDAVVMDKWFSMHATKASDDILSQLDLLQGHKQYSITNPNKVRSLIGSFAFYNTQGFHQASGAGYKYLADYIIKLDTLNPQVSSRLITPLIQFGRYNEAIQIRMKEQLNRIFTTKGLSNDVFEKVSKALSS